MDLPNIFADTGDGALDDFTSVAGEALIQKRFKLSARVSSDNPSAVRAVVEEFLAGNGSIKTIAEEFEVEAELTGESARSTARSYHGCVKLNAVQGCVQNGPRTASRNVSSIMYQKARKRPTLEPQGYGEIAAQAGDANPYLDSILVVLDVNFEWFQRKYCILKERIRTWPNSRNK